MGPGTTLIFVSDVAFADITGQHENFSRWKEYARLARTHVAFAALTANLAECGGGSAVRRPATAAA